MIEALNIIVSLLVTLSIETFIYMFLDNKSLKLFITVLAMNIVLNLSMNISMLFIHPESMWYVALVIWEISTTVIESLIIKFINKYKYWKSILFAFLANATSLLVGILLWPLEKEKTTIIILIIVFGILFCIEFCIQSIITINNLIKNK